MLSILENQGSSDCGSSIWILNAPFVPIIAGVLKHIGFISVFVNTGGLQQNVDWVELLVDGFVLSVLGALSGGGRILRNLSFMSLHGEVQGWLLGLGGLLDGLLGDLLGGSLGGGFRSGGGSGAGHFIFVFILISALIEANNKDRVLTFDDITDYLLSTELQFILFQIMLLRDSNKEEQLLIVSRNFSGSII